MEFILSLLPGPSDHLRTLPIARQRVEAWLSRAIVMFVLSLGGLLAHWGYESWQASRSNSIADDSFDGESSFEDTELSQAELADSGFRHESARVPRPFPGASASRYSRPMTPQRRYGEPVAPQGQSRVWRIDEPFIRPREIVPVAYQQDDSTVEALSHEGLTEVGPPLMAPAPPSVPTSEQPESLTGPPVTEPLRTTEAVPDNNPQSPFRDSRQFSFNFQGAPWNLVLKKFAEEAGLSLQLASPPEGTFTFFDPNKYTLREALDIYNDALLAKGYIAVWKDQTLTILSTQSEFSERLIPFVTVEQLPSLGRNELACVAIPVGVGQAQATAQELSTILSPLGKAKPLTSSQTVLVIDIGSSLQRVHQLTSTKDDPRTSPQTFVYQLRNTPAEDVALAINDFLAGRRPSANQTVVNAGGTFPSRGSLSSSSGLSGGDSDRGLTVIAEKTTNSLMIRGTAAEVAEIQELIVQLDRLPPQVVIQALLVEVELGDTDEFGVELGAQDSVLFDRSVIDNLVTLASTTTAPNGVQTTNQTVISRTSNPGFNFNNQPLGNNTAVHPSRVGTQGLSSLGVGRVNGDLGFGGLVLSAGSESISVLLRALQQNYHVDILSRPQIRSLDNHEAMIQIGRQVPVIDGISITAVGGANPVIRQDQSGIILKVTPRISPDDQVMIDVQAEKSAFLLTPGTGVPIFTDPTNGNVIEAPVKDITTAAATVSVRSGQTIVLGGMITRDTTNLQRKVPWLGDIPYLGELFKYRYVDTKRKELLIFLTPIVIAGEADADRIKLEEMQRITMPYEDAEQIHGRILVNPDGDFEQAVIPDVQAFSTVDNEAVGNEFGEPAPEPTEVVPEAVAPTPVPAFPRPVAPLEPQPTEAEPLPPVPQVKQSTPTTSRFARFWKPLKSNQTPTSATDARSAPTRSASTPNQRTVVRPAARTRSQ